MLEFNALPQTLHQAINFITAITRGQGNTFTAKFFIGLVHIDESATTKLVLYSSEPKEVTL